MINTEKRTDKSLVFSRFARAVDDYENSAVVQRNMAHQLAVMAAPYLQADTRWFEFGSGCGMLTRELLKFRAATEIITNDLVGENECQLRNIAEKMQPIQFDFVRGDVEVIDIPLSCGMIWSNAAMQWMNDVPALLRKIAMSLIDHGVVAFSTFGLDNFKEIRSITGIGLDYSSTAKLQEMMAESFETVIFNEWTEVLWFNDPIDVLNHIRLTGVGGIKVNRWGKGDLKRFCDDYQQFYVAGKGYSLTYHPVLVVAIK